MTTAVDTSGGGSAPARKPRSPGTPWKIGPVGEERARICIRAAELRARAEQLFEKV